MFYRYTTVEYNGFVSIKPKLYIFYCIRSESQTAFEHFCTYSCRAATNSCRTGTLGGITTGEPPNCIGSWVVAVFFSGPLGGEISPPKFKISPPNTNKFEWPAGCFSHFLPPQKQFPPPNYNSRKKPWVVVGGW